MLGSRIYDRLQPFLVLSSLLILALLMTVGAYAEEGDGLEFEDDSKISVTLDADAGAFTRTLLLRNNSPQPLNVQISAILLDSSSNVQTADVRVEGSTPEGPSSFTVRGGSVVPVRVSVTLTEPLSLPLSGELVATAADGQAEPASRLLHIAAEEPTTRPFDLFGIIQLTVPRDAGTGIILLSGALALIMCLVLRFGYLPQVIRNFRDRHYAKGGLPEWNPRVSFVGNFTLVSALIGSIASAGVLPEETFHLHNSGYVLLGVFFAAILLVAPLIFNMSVEERRSASDPAKKEPYGRIGALLWTTGLILWALLGQLITILFLLNEMKLAGPLPLSFISSFQVIVILAGLLMLRYMAKKIPTVIGQGDDPAKEPLPITVSSQENLLQQQTALVAEGLGKAATYEDVASIRSRYLNLEGQRLQARESELKAMAPTGWVGDPPPRRWSLY